MKYANQVAIVVALLVIGVCFAPWVYIDAIDSTITGLHAPRTNFGRPGIMNIVFSATTIVLTLAQSIWAKRINLFICSFNFSWAIRNFLVTTQCAMGECPVKLWGIYALTLLTFALLIFSFFPQLRLLKSSALEVD